MSAPLHHRYLFSNLRYKDYYADENNQTTTKDDELFTTSNRQLLHSERIHRILNTKYLVITGGATRGIATCGAIEQICRIHDTIVYNNNSNDHNIVNATANATANIIIAMTKQSFLSKLTACGGSSIGALIALACLCQVQWSIMRQLVIEQSVAVMNWIHDHMSLSHLIQYKGLCTHEPLYYMVDQLFNALKLPQNITFEQLYHYLKGKVFICSAVRVMDNQVVYMSCKHTPTMSVRRALVMSMCMPILFAPLKNDQGGMEYMDAAALGDDCLLEQFFYWFPDQHENMLCLYNDVPYHGTISHETSIMDWIMNMYTCMLKNQQDLWERYMSTHYQETWKNACIRILFSKDCAETISFFLDRQTSRQLYMDGIRAVMHYLHK